MAHRRDRAHRALTGKRLSGYPYRTLFVWIAALALIWLALCSPWPEEWNAVGAALVVFLAIAGLVVATRRLRARREATQHVPEALDRALGSLPHDIKRHTPLILAASDAIGPLADIFGDTPVRITDAAIWVRCDEPTQLMHLADTLKRWRDGQGPDAVAVLIAADRLDSESSLAASLRRWRSAISGANRAIGYALPVCAAIYAEEAHQAPDVCPWFGFSGGTPSQDESLPTLVALRATEYIRLAGPPDRQLRAHRAALLDTLARWTSDVVLPALGDEQRGSPSIRVAALGVTLVEGCPAPNSLVGRFITQSTGLTLAATQGRRQSYPLPDALLRGMAPQAARHALPRALAHAFVWLALGFCATAAASAWQNRALVERIVADMGRYKAITPAQDAARVDALKAVKHDRDELEHYARSGVPPRLGLGFYGGASLLAPLNTLIAGYQPPQPPPSTIELNSLSLFRTNSAVLNPGSNRVLVGALDMIKAHPDKRVLVAGHTDSVGNPDSNLKLSEARAASVRNWLADASGIPLSHFATQGYGDTRPKAPNDTEAGRAANRRVEITLVPDCRDTRGDSNSHPPTGQPACAFQ